MSAVLFTPSQTRHLYDKKRRATTLSIPLQEGGIAANTRASFRWIVLIIICFAMFVYSYCYDNPVALQNQLQNKYGLSDIQYNLLYSAYSFPNMILPFFSGLLADILGADIMIIIFFIFIVIGQSTFIIGCILSYYPIMFIGRLLFGIGAESFQLVITPLIYEYFKDKELSFALGLLLSLSRMGSSANDYLTFYIYSKTNNIIFALFVGLCLLIIGVIAIIALLIQRYSVRYVIKKKKKKKNDGIVNYNKSSILHGSITSVSSGYPINSKPQTIDITPAANNVDKNKYRANKAASYDEHTRYYHSLTNSLLAKEAILMEDKETNNKDIDDIDNADKFKLSDIKQFDLVYWILVINCGLMYGVVLSFMNIGSDYLQIHYNYSHGTGNTLLMIPYIVGAVLTPFLGYLSDKIGKRGYLLLLSTMMLIISHYILTWFSTSCIYFAIIGLCALGISYSIFCAVIWPSFALVVPDRLIGTGYGIPCVFYNTILSIFYVLVGVLPSIGSNKTNHNIDNNNYYQNVEIFLFSVSIFTTFSVILLIIADKRSGSRLNIPTMSQS